jgi:hypothetical protein
MLVTNLSASFFRHLALLVALLVVPALGACGTEVDTLASIQSALDTPLGGFRLDEEMPRFGRDDLDVAPLKQAVQIPEIPDLGYVSVPQPPAGAPRGFLTGFWIDYAKGIGVMGGKWANERGEVIGHLKGVYGCSKTYRYDWVFLGKLIDLNGVAKGIVSGRHRHGRFRGTWVDEQQNIKGVIVGYAAGNTRFAGRWQSLEAPEQNGVGEIPWHLLR